MNSELFFSFMTSLLICMALIPPLGLLASRLHIVDQPGSAKSINILSRRLVALRLRLELLSAFCGGDPKTAPRCRYSLAD